MWWLHCYSDIHSSGTNHHAINASKPFVIHFNAKVSFPCMLCSNIHPHAPLHSGVNMGTAYWTQSSKTSHIMFSLHLISTLCSISVINQGHQLTNKGRIRQWMALINYLTDAYKRNKTVPLTLVQQALKFFLYWWKNGILLQQQTLKKKGVCI